MCNNFTNRSEDMQLYQLMMQLDDAWDTINDFGKIECVHFVDLNKDKLPHNLKYSR
jgi:hypothetical protein